MSENREQQSREIQHQEIKVEVNDQHAHMFLHDQEKNRGLGDEKSSSEILQIYLKSLGYGYGKKRQRCISRELG